MVGVPGRSKGCHACRKQKIACSQERPACRACVRAGRPCPGYQRERIFVNLEATEAKAKGGGKHGPITNRYSPHSQTNGPPTPTTGSAHSKTLPPLEDQIPCGAPGSPVSSALVTQRGLSAAAVYRQQLLGTFFARFGGSERISEVTPQHWLTAVPSRPQLSAALEVAAAAYCTAKLGRAAMQTAQTTTVTSDSRVVRPRGADGQALIHESLRLYTRGLRELQAALYDPRQQYADDTLGACVLLAMYEVFECPSNNRRAYVSHHGGAARLIQLRGPHAHTSGLGHSIFTSFRVMGTLEALVTRQTFLTEPEWQRTPYLEVPKSPMDQLLDIVLESPAIMAKADRLPTLPTMRQQYQCALELLAACAACEARLRTFAAQLAADHGPRLYWEEPAAATTAAATEDPATTALFPTRFVFVDVPAAGVLMLYWASLTMLLAGIVRLDGIVGPLRAAALLEDSAVPLPPLPPPAMTTTADFLDTARSVCKGVPFCLADGSDLGLSAVAAPLTLVRDVLAAWPALGGVTATEGGDGFAAELPWVRDMIERVRRRGMGIVGLAIEGQ